MPDQGARKPIHVTIYTDYICPFCFIGHVRLEKLRGEFDLEIDWRFIEIHPDHPPEGKPVTELGYSRRQWRRMMGKFARLAAEEGIRLPPRTFTTNSRRALKLALATREHQPDRFDALNQRLYEAFFLESHNIGDPDVLRALAAEHGVSPELPDQAWIDPLYDEILRENQHSAINWGAAATPTFVFGDQPYTGAIPIHMMRHAIKKANPQARP